MSKQPPAAAQKHSALRATVTVGGRRWHRLADANALRLAAAGSRVYVLDTVTGIVRFGDGVHGARPPAGARVRVHYRHGAGTAGNVAVSWEGHWPPCPFALAKSLMPDGSTTRSTNHKIINKIK